MRRLPRRPVLIALALLALALAGVAAPRPAAAHPLGNFSVNTYCRVEPSADGLRLRYALDMAEIPTFQELSARGLPTDGSATPAQLAALADDIAARLAAGLALEAGGRRLPLTAGAPLVELRPGQAGLSTLYVRLDLTAPLPSGPGPWDVSFRDPVFGDRPGWREAVVRAAGSARLLSSSAPADDLSAELTSYPEDLLLTPPASAGAEFRFALGGPGAADAPAPAVAPAARATDRLTELATAHVSGPLSLAGALLAALLLGAGHALTPGHGKTVVAAYLVGARGTVGHAVFLGVTTTVTHTAGVFGLGLVTLFVSSWVLPERLYPWLGALSGALVAAIGVALLRQRLGTLLATRGGAQHGGHGQGDLDAHGGHEHGFGYHTHAPAPAVSWRGLLALGVSGGLLPCPSALVLLLGAVALGRPALGLLLVLSFSLGLAGVLTAIGVLLVRARALFARLPGGGRLLPGLSLAGAAVVTVAGVAITLQALAQAGLAG